MLQRECFRAFVVDGLDLGSLNNPIDASGIAYSRPIRP